MIISNPSKNTSNRKKYINYNGYYRKSERRHGMDIEALQLEIQRIQQTIAENEELCSESYKEALDKLERLVKLLNDYRRIESEDRKIDYNYAIEDEKIKESRRRAKFELIGKIAMILAALALGGITIYAEGFRAVTSKAFSFGKMLLKI